MGLYKYKLNTDFSVKDLSINNIKQLFNKLNSINIYRIKRIIILLIVILLAFLIKDYYNFSKIKWNTIPEYKHSVYAHMFFLIGVVISFFLVNINFKENSWYKNFPVYFAVFVILSGCFYITYSYVIRKGLIAIFAFGAFGVAISIYLKHLYSIIFFALYYTAFIVLIFSIQISERLLSSYFVNSTIIITMSVFISISIYNIKVRDIVSEMIVEEQNDKLEVKNVELKSISLMKDNFVAMVNHDLKNVMSSILSSTKYILKNDLPDEFKEYVELLNKTTKTLLKLADDFLQVSLFESGKIKLDLSEVDLDELIHDVINTYSFMINSKEININCIIKNSENVIIDREKMYTVLSNLISNAIKFTHKGKNIDVICGSKNENIEIHVIDNGIGIHEEEIERIFNLYEKAKQNENNAIKGTGLGLAICRQIVNLHKGTINVTSEVGQGSDFCIKIPFLNINENDKLLGKFQENEKIKI